MRNHERRSAARAGVQIDWVGHEHGQGVGARQARARPRPGGGGYLNECTTPEVWEHAKIRELSEMGLPGLWVEIARLIGYDRFMAMWRRLDAEIALRSDSEAMIEVEIRRFSSFERYQRNRFIEALAAMGATDSEIRARVKRELGEELSQSHIRRLASKRRVRA